MKKIFYPICILSILISSCVPQRILEETKTKLTNCETESANLKKQIKKLKINLNLLQKH